MYFKFTSSFCNANFNYTGEYKYQFIVDADGFITASTTIEQLLDYLKAKRASLNDYGRCQWNLPVIAIKANNYKLFDDIIAAGGIEPLNFFQTNPLEALIYHTSQGNIQAKQSLMKILDMGLHVNLQQLKTLLMINQRSNLFSDDLLEIIGEVTINTQPPKLIDLSKLIRFGLELPQEVQEKIAKLQEIDAIEQQQAVRHNINSPRL